MTNTDSTSSPTRSSKILTKEEFLAAGERFAAIPRDQRGETAAERQERWDREGVDPVRDREHIETMRLLTEALGRSRRVLRGIGKALSENKWQDEELRQLDPAVHRRSRHMPTTAVPALLIVARDRRMARHLPPGIRTELGLTRKIQPLPKSGHAPRSGANTRSTGSRRGGSANRAGPDDDPGESSEPPGGRHPCKNSAHERYRRSSDPLLRGDLDALGVSGDHCHRNCKQQAYRLRNGGRPEGLASPPKGWHPPTLKASQKRAPLCKCKGPDGPPIDWPEPHRHRPEPWCVLCGRRVPIVGIEAQEFVRLADSLRRARNRKPRSSGFASSSYITAPGRRWPDNLSQSGEEPLVYWGSSSDPENELAEVIDLRPESEPIDADLEAIEVERVVA